MGYTTTFSGEVTLNKPLTEELYFYLINFSRTRHMKRDVEMLKEAGFTEDYGVEGEFFVENTDYYSKIIGKDETIIDINTPPSTQPGLWCQWIPNHNRVTIEWDGGEKFYHAAEWMDYLITKILVPQVYIANGKIYAYGEDSDDHWMLSVVDNEVKIYTGYIVYKDEHGNVVE